MRDFPEITMRLAKKLKEVRDNKGFIEGTIIKVPDLRDQEKLLKFLERHPSIDGDEVALSVLDFKRNKRKNFIAYLKEKDSK